MNLKLLTDLIASFLTEPANLAERSAGSIQQDLRSAEHGHFGQRI
jgi:hypothetical protein